ncbi:hypothetical protein RB195_002871 [Necator americanus]|uniref:DUF5641 domain-containing protein n=1 Tax=Necator americanus TaxID=51031 RepID=A0ABR1DL21_NECAM
MWKSTNEIVTSFWKRWKAENLVSLREQYKRSHHHARLEIDAQPSLEDYVDSVKRGQWKLGQIIGSNDKFQRAVNVRVANKNIITRSINLISPLEVLYSSRKEQQPNRHCKTSVAAEPHHTMTTRSKTNAIPNVIVSCVTLLATLIGFASSEMAVVNS